MNNDFFKQALECIDYLEKQTSDTEIFGIHRVPSTSGCVEFVKLYKDTIYKPHIHDKASAKFFFLKGSGYVIYNDEKIRYEIGSHIDVPAGVKHGFEQDEETIFLSIQSNPIEDRETGIKDIRYE